MDDRSSLGRRRFLAGAAAMLVLPRGVAGQRPRFDRYPFTLGVASGDPLADGVVLWTRLAPEVLEGGGMPPVPVGVVWEVSEDDQFRRIVRSGTATARAEAAHTVHVDVRGLAPAQWYWYRFRVYGTGGPIDSPVGRTRTAPRPDAVVDEFRFVSASCQRYDDGLYTAHRLLADEDVHLVLFLGDYIYEQAALAGTVRPHPPTAAATLADYRHRYALYKSDPDLQQSHQAFPWMVIWDDHEVFDDYAGQVVRGDPALRLRQRAAYQAFLEHIPSRASLASHDNAVQMYRRVSLGRLATLHMLDTRQYRSAHVCGDGVQHPCAALLDGSRMMLGGTQEQWLFDGLRAAGESWQIIAQQVPFATVDREAGPGVSQAMDKWDGYPLARERLLGAIAERRRHDTVVLTGDNHNHWVMELRRAAAADNAPPLATEFVSTSITSTGDGAEQREAYSAVLGDNPHARYFNSRRGYLRCIVTPAQWRSDFRVVPFVSRPGAPVTTDASFVLTRDSPHPARV
jgi:alkaline phosphatase D